MGISGNDVSFYTPFDPSFYCTCIKVSNNLTNNVSGGIFETLLAFASTLEDDPTFDSNLCKSSPVNFPMTLAFL